MSDVGFIMCGLIHIRLLDKSRAANDDVHLAEPPGPRPPPTPRMLDDLSVRRAEREFLRS